MAKQSSRKLVLVDWMDSWSHDRWTNFDALEADGEPLICRSVGWVAHETRRVLVLVSSVSAVGRDDIREAACMTMAIPKVAIVSRRVLRS